MKINMTEEAQFFRPWNAVPVPEASPVHSVKSEPADRSSSVGSAIARNSPSASSLSPRYEGADIERLSNFVAMTTKRDSSLSSWDSNSPIDQSSAFTPTTRASLDYYGNLSGDSSAIAFDLSAIYHGSPFYGYNFGVPAYAGVGGQAGIEEAVQLLHQQDLVAKQMKKMRPKKFKCEHCGVAFSNNGQLKGHVRIHTGERPFKCDAENCGKSFTRNEELTRHKRIHTGQRPHICHVCGKAFGRKDHLKKHTRTHENRSSYLASVIPGVSYSFPTLTLPLHGYAL